MAKKPKEESLDSLLEKKFGKLAKPLRDEKVGSQDYWEHHENHVRNATDGYSGESPLANPDVLSEYATPYKEPLTDEAVERLEVIKSALHLLSPQQARVIHLCGVEGLSIDAAAKEMGIAKGAADTLIRRARAKIQRFYEQRKTK